MPAQPQTRSSSASCFPDDLFLTLPRERDAWNILLRTHAAEEVPGSRFHLVADLSQTVTRSRAVAGQLPTITPGSVLAMAQPKRVLSPLEKVLLHAFPLHKMSIPANTTQKQLQDMGGNTMHVQVVACAISLLLGLVDWSLPASSAAPVLPIQKGPHARRRARKPGETSRPLQKALASLASRWGLHPRQEVKKCCKKKARPGPAAVQPRHIRALAGTRWG